MSRIVKHTQYNECDATRATAECGAADSRNTERPPQACRAQVLEENLRQTIQRRNLQFQKNVISLFNECLFFIYDRG